MQNKVVVAGASGLVGTAAVEKFLAEEFDVVAVSRRRPEVDEDRQFEHLAVDLRDSEECRRQFENMHDVTHVVYAAVYEKPGLVPGWSERDQMETNLAMLSNLMEPLSKASPGLQHVSLLQGTKAYGVHLHPMRIPGRERQPRDPHENFYWLQEDYIRQKSSEDGWAFSIWRPQVVVGPNYGVVMNLAPVIGAFAAICWEEGRPFGFPGGVPWVLEAVDTRLVAAALAWGATAENAKGETFNLTNGEVFEWRDLWPAMAEALGVEAAPADPLSLARFLPGMADVWDRIVEKYGLRKVSMTELLGESHHYADFCFAFGAEQQPPPAFVSTIKVKQAGFTDTQDTEEMFRHWLQVLMDRRVLPPR
jgi:nucleoside-diphosphate-sugar epimerase